MSVSCRATESTGTARTALPASFAIRRCRPTGCADSAGAAGPAGPGRARFALNTPGATKTGVAATTA
ncbi:hypothetical protein MPRG_49930 [Mycobacterium paragordonae]|uniref:Uncharacterized protein n=1 Tax=Mycobacterium paragordonae TaxID=1389713 RepID=A0ABQ1CBY6_9MYCO|nr:hypothetical protein MPRG_49930 [Mycobacterium paragordonae]